MDGNRHMDCLWVGRKGDLGSRRQHKCNREDVVRACPIQCGLCCADDDTFNFRLDNGKTQNCAWIKFKYLKRQDFCNQPQIKQACPLTCNNCFTPVIPRPVDENDDDGDGENCVTDPDFRLNGNRKKNCNWVAEKGDKGNRRRRSCQKKKVQVACPTACGLCCADDDDFRFIRDNMSIEKCSWIKENYRKRKKYCEQSEIKAGCARTCRNCLDPVNARKKKE